MRAGRLRHRVIIEKQVDGEDDQGFPLQDYEKVFSAKTDFRIMSSGDLLKAGVALTSEIATVLMRFDARLNYSHVMNYKGNRYDVDGIKPNDNNTEMIVTVSREIQ